METARYKPKKRSMLDPHIDEINELYGSMSFMKLIDFIVNKYPDEYPNGINYQTMYNFCRSRKLWDRTFKTCHTCDKCVKIRHTKKRGYLLCTAVEPWQIVKSDIVSRPAMCPMRKTTEQDIINTSENQIEMSR